MTARQSAGLADDLETFARGLIAAVEDEAMGGDERGGTEVIVTGPERRAGSGAGRAQNALGGLVETGALFRRLQALASVRGDR